MVTTHLGKIKRVDRIRDAIYNEMMEGLMDKKINSHIFLDREILFYLLLKHGIDENGALYCTTRIYGDGRKIVSRGLKEMFACTSNELGQKQFTKFISKFMKSGRIELLDTAPYTWRMNGFSTFEEPYIGGYKCEEKKFFEEKLRREILENNKEKEKYNKQLEFIDKELEIIYKNISNNNIEPETIKRRSHLIEERKKLQQGNVV